MAKLEPIAPKASAIVVVPDSGQHNRMEPTFSNEEGTRRRSLPWFLAGAAGAMGATYGIIIARSWLGYGRRRVVRRDPLLDSFMPEFEIEDRHAARIEAPADLTYQVAKRINMSDSKLASAIFFVRTLPSRIRGHGVEPESPKGFVAQTESLGWRKLAEIPGRRLVMGAVTQPWKGEVQFRGLAPGQFAEFNEPDYVKIIWTIGVEPINNHACIFRTETRAVATDEESRRLFRRYWSVVAPGVKLIRVAMLAQVRKEAKRALEGLPAVVH